MINSNISFTGKIPVSKFNVYDGYKDKYVGATLYELDCEDEQDIFEVECAPNIFKFTRSILSHMNIKALYNKTKKFMPPDIFEKYCAQDNPSVGIYIAKTDDTKETIGICQTNFTDDGEIVEHIAVNNVEPYKYIGQGILASIGKNVVDRFGTELSIYDPLDETREYYTEKCGFKEISPKFLTMHKDDIEGFVQRVEEKTHGKIIDLQV